LIPLSLNISTSPTVDRIIGHLIGPNFEYQERLLELTLIIVLHTEENLDQNEIMPVLQKFTLKSKLLTVTQNTAQNYERMI